MDPRSRDRVTAERWRHASARILGAAGAAVLAVLAARADAQVGDAEEWRIALDVAVGLAFVASAVFTPGTTWARALVWAVGGSWLVGSIVHDAALVHQALLVVVLVAFPSGRVRGVMRWLLVALAIPVALLLIDQIGVAALFGAVAVTALVSPGPKRVAGWYPAVAAAGVALVLAASWSATRWEVDAFDPSARLLSYELVVLAIAITVPIATRAVISDRARLTDDVLGATGLAGLDGLAAVLRDVLGDPDLRIYRWRGPQGGYVDSSDGSALGSAGERHVLAVDGDGGPLGAVVHRAAALDDPPTAAAVATAVRLAVVHHQLQEELSARLEDLAAARMRLVAAADRQRVATAARLRADVVGPVERVSSALRATGLATADGEVAEAVGVVVHELTAAAGDVAAAVGGIPPAELGGGGLCAAVEELASRSPIDVTVRASPVTSADTDTETALFYVCSEAITNAVKHARATSVTIAIDVDDLAMWVTVTDDGCGGADATGSGLQGLADRLAARRGRLQVVSPPGAGTIVTATVPR